MSALPPKADTLTGSINVRSVPVTVIWRRGNDPYRQQLLLVGSLPEVHPH